MTSEKKFVYSLEIPVRWCDMDAFGHVNNSVYLSYFESARIGWWKQISPQEITFNQEGPVVINAYCTFFKAIIYPTNLIVKLFVGPPGRSSYESYYEIRSQENPEVLYAEGSTKVVWVDRVAEHSIPLPDFIIQHLLS